MLLFQRGYRGFVFSRRPRPEFTSRILEHHQIDLVVMAPAGAAAGQRSVRATETRKRISREILGNKRTGVSSTLADYVTEAEGEFLQQQVV